MYDDGDGNSKHGVEDGFDMEPSVLGQICFFVNCVHPCRLASVLCSTDIGWVSILLLLLCSNVWFYGSDMIGGHVFKKSEMRMIVD